MTQPAVPSAVSYGDVREGNASYRAAEPWTHSQQTGVDTVRGRGRCPHRDGEGRGWRGWRTQVNARYTSSQTTSQRCWKAGATRAVSRGHGRSHALSWAPHAPGGARAPPPCGGDCDGPWEPRTSPARAREPEGKPRGVRAWEDGRSKRRPVMGWRGGEPTGNLTPRASGQTSIWSGITRDLGQPPQGRKPMTAVATLTGALSDRLTGRRLQARMVKVGPQPGVRRGTIAFRKERWQGLSCLKGNFHEQF